MSALYLGKCGHVRARVLRWNNGEPRLLEVFLSTEGLDSSEPSFVATPDQARAFARDLLAAFPEERKG